MPFYGTESLRIDEVETDGVVEAISNIAEDSVHQYSRAQTQRANNARKQINQEKNTRAEDKENIEVTISEDLADGTSAKLDASLKVLSQGDSKLLLVSDELEDDEIHIIETTSEAPLVGNHSLQDYQMQLMLVEQQKRKRRLMVRQEKYNKVRFAQFDHLASTREYERLKRRQATYEEQLRLMAADEPTSGVGARHVKNKMPTSSAHEDAASVTKSQKRITRSRPQSGQQNHSSSAKSEDPNKADVESLEVRSILRSSKVKFSLTVYH